jgi:serine protease Do
MSPTERGFKEGDVILEVAGKSVTSAGDVREAITADAERQQEQRSHSREQRRFVAVPLARG